MPTLYDALQVAETATPEIIRYVFKRLARESHPDRVKEGDKEKAEERFKAISSAFDVLSDETKRAKYDEELRVARAAEARRNVRVEVRYVRVPVYVRAPDAAAHPMPPPPARIVEPPREYPMPVMVGGPLSGTRVTPAPPLRDPNMRVVHHPPAGNQDR